MSSMNMEPYWWPRVRPRGMDLVRALSGHWPFNRMRFHHVCTLVERAYGGDDFCRSLIAEYVAFDWTTKDED